MSALESPIRAQPVSSRGRLKRLLLAGLGLLLLGALAVLAWMWRHPSAFEDYGGWGVGHTDWRVGRTAYVGMTFPDDRAGGSIRIHGAEPHGLADSTGADLAYFLCTPRSGPAGAAIGIASASEASRQCGRLVPAGNETLSLSEQQLVVAITPRREGVVALHGLDLHYGDGWQSGTQRVGGDVRVRVRSAG
jgi:hypothetical protein